jgi:diguanylate cyclase (GGDEF)-like protein/PAS domain S-box-containing protein
VFAIVVKKHTIVKKSRLIILLISLLMAFGGFAVVMLLAEHRAITIEHAVDQAQNDVAFMSGLVKEAYLKKEYSRIEDILDNWIKRSKLDHMLKVEGANGFVLYEFHRGHKPDAPMKIHYPEDSYTVVNDIMDGNHLLMRFTLVRDLGFIMQEYYALRDRVVLISVLCVLLLLGVMWGMLRQLVFKPLESEIDKRLQAERELLESHEVLEAKVERRTADLKNSNLELQNVLEKYRLSEAQMEKLSRAIEQTDDIVTITNRKGVIEYVNPSLERVTGFSASEVLGKTPAIFQSGEHDKSFYDELWRTIRNGESFNEVFVNRRKDGSFYYEEKTITPIKDEEGEIIYFVATGKDITDRIKVQERLQYMATHDDLTDLPNRTLLRDRLSQAVTKAERDGSRVALLFLDMDKFKHVNDSLGHIVGDQLLRIVAERIGQCVRKGDTIARLGGDEFTVVMEGIEEIDDVNRIARKIINQLSEEVFVGKYQLRPSTSVGVTIAPDDASSVDELLKNADIAMYRAKARGGNCYQYFTEDMTAHAVEYLEIQNKLSKALANDEFEVYYQPRIQVATGKICGMEALLRWHSDSMGLVMPDKFIPVLEESQQIVDVGIWVLNRACEFNQALIEQGFPAISISVNLSARQFRDQKTLEAIKSLQQRYASLQGFLEVEITETLLVENIEMAAGIMHQLHNLGVSIAVDDFGTGYSSMTYLKRFPIDALKIDRSFVTDTPDDQDDVSIVQAIIALAKSLNMRSIAEGVETNEQRQLLELLECDEVQGFLVSHPISADDFINWLLQHQQQNAAQIK